MNKKIIIVILLSFMTISLMAKDVKMTIRSNADSDIKIVVLKQGFMMSTLVEGVLKNGDNSFNLSIPNQDIYGISFSIGEKRNYVKVMISDDFGFSIDNNMMVKFSGANKDFNNAVFTLTNKYRGEIYALSDRDKVTNKASRAKYAIYEKQLEDIKSMNLPAETAEMVAGYMQGDLLSNIYSRQANAKVMGKMSMGLVIEEKHSEFLTDMKLNKYLPLYSQWDSNLNEFLYARIEAGKIKVKNPETWVADMATSIKDETLRNAYICNTLEREVLMGYSRNIEKRFAETKKVVKDNAVLEKIAETESKLPKVLEINKSEGQYVGDITFEDVNGNLVPLSNFKGKYIFIDMWSTGCNPCIGEIPYMHKLEHDFGNSNIAFISVTMDTDKDVWKKFMNDNNMGGTQLFCTDGFKNPFCKIVSMRGIPHFIIIDKEGKIMNRNSYRPSNPVVRAELKSLK